jgi:hypothetical protein
MEDIPSGEVVAAEMFLVNHHPAIVLFDSRASHSFMSPTFASKYDQDIFMVKKGGYCISATRNDISTNQIVKDVLISISEREYTANLVVLPGLGIDVILGMNWMKDHGVLIDTSTRTIMLRDPKNNEAFLVPLPRNFDLQNLACAIQTTTLFDVPMVCEFLDVFLDELLGLPPDQDVEFKIELLPSTTPVTPLGVKHTLTSQSMSISITYMFIITCNIS